MQTPQRFRPTRLLRFSLRSMFVGMVVCGVLSAVLRPPSLTRYPVTRYPDEEVLFVELAHRGEDTGYFWHGPYQLRDARDDRLLAAGQMRHGQPEGSWVSKRVCRCSLFISAEQRQRVMLVHFLARIGPSQLDVVPGGRSCESCRASISGSFDSS